MRIKHTQLTDAVTQNIINEQQAQQLWLFLKTQNKDTPSLKTTHILYYLGGSIMVIGTLLLLMDIGLTTFGGIGLFSIALVYAVLGIVFTELLLKRYQLVIPATILATLVIAVVPLGVYGLADYFTFGIDDWRSLLVEITALVVGIVMLIRYRLPFLSMPIILTLSAMIFSFPTPSVENMPLLNGTIINYLTDHIHQLRQIVLFLLGLFILIVAFAVDIKSKSRKDFAFWLYCGGVSVFWGALNMIYLDSNSSESFGQAFLVNALYCAINLAMILIGAALARRVFVIFGGLGVAISLVFFSNSLNKYNILSPFVFTLIGLIMIGVGVYWQRHEQQVNHLLQRLLPKKWRALVTQRRDDYF